MSYTLVRLEFGVRRCGDAFAVALVEGGARAFVGRFLVGAHRRAAAIVASAVVVVLGGALERCGDLEARHADVLGVRVRLAHFQLEHVSGDVDVHELRHVGGRPPILVLPLDAVRVLG